MFLYKRVFSLLSPSHSLPCVSAVLKVLFVCFSDDPRDRWPVLLSSLAPRALIYLLICSTIRVQNESALIIGAI